MSELAIGVIILLAIACFAGMYRLGRPAKASATSAELRARYPDAAWKWNPLWAGGVVQGALKSNVYFHWLFTTIWTLLSAPMAYVLRDEIVVKKNYAAAVGLLFPLISVFLLIHVIRLTWQWFKYGSSQLRMVTFPGEIGGRFRARLDTPLKDIPEAGVKLGLTSLRIITGSGDSNRENILWHEERVVPKLSLSPRAGGVTIPIDFYIPADAESSTPPREPGEVDAGGAVVWKLSVSAEVPGINYQTEFEVPVFVTGDEPEHSEAHRFGRERETSFDPAEATVQVSSTGNGGTRFYFPMGRNPGVPWSITFFTAIWWAVIAFMRYIGFGMIFTGLFGLFGLLLAWVSLDTWFGTFTVTIEGGEVQARSSLLGMGSTLRIAKSEIESFEVTMGMNQKQTMTQSAKAWYDIEVKRKIGKPKSIAKGLKSKREAEWLARRMRNALGIF